MRMLRYWKYLTVVALTILIAILISIHSEPKLRPSEWESASSVVMEGNLNNRELTYETNKCYTDLVINSEEDAIESMRDVREELGIECSDLEFNCYYSIGNAADNRTVYFLSQRYKGIPITLGSAHVFVDNETNKVVGLKCYDLTYELDLSTTPRLSESWVLEKVAEEYSESYVKMRGLMIEAYSQKLVYNLHLGDAQSKVMSLSIFIDANTGELVKYSYL